MNLLERIRLWFPTVSTYKQEADKALREVEALKTLTFNGDEQWFIDQCRQHKEEVCNDKDNAA